MLPSNVVLIFHLIAAKSYLTALHWSTQHLREHEASLALSERFIYQSVKIAAFECEYM